MERLMCSFPPFEKEMPTKCCVEYCREVCCGRGTRLPTARRVLPVSSSRLSYFSLGEVRKAMNSIAMALLISLEMRVERLESALLLSLGLLQTLRERVESKLGPDFLGEEFKLLAVDTNSPARQEVTRIDGLIQAGQQPKAARLFRDLTGVTWDEAHHIISRWGAFPFEQKVKWLQLALWVKVLAGPSDGNIVPTAADNR